MPQLDDLIALALNAGREIMTLRATGLDAQAKQDGSLVTLADQRAEAIIEEGLARLAPNIPMIGEEAVASGRIPEIGANFYLVDPLDGTRGFAKGGDEFTVNIALVENAAPVMGVVYAPATGELYAGEPGRALRRAAAPSQALTPIAAQGPSPSQWRVIASDHSGRNERTARFVAGLGACTTHASSSIKFCRLAEGAADLYPRFGNVNEWDIAAGHAILVAAGGGVLDLEGKPVRYGGRNGEFLVFGFLAYASAPALEAALPLLTR